MTRINSKITPVLGPRLIRGLKKNLILQYNCTFDYCACHLIGPDPNVLHLEYISESNKRQNPVNEYTFLYYVFASSIALIVAAIAYLQLKNINKNLKADYLVRVDERWRSNEIIKARVIIHELYLDSIQQLTGKELCSKATVRETIGNKIIEMSTKKDKSENYIQILNFLDFMETVGFLHTEGYLETKSLDELFGASIEFNYEIFSNFISHRRNKHDIPDFYEEFRKLYDAIQKYKNNKKNA